MTKTIEAIYRNGVLKPLEDLDIPEEKKVQITIDTDLKAPSESILKLAQKVYEGLSAREIVDIEAIALDRTNFFQERS